MATVHKTGPYHTWNICDEIFEPHLYACGKKVDQRFKHVLVWKRLDYGIDTLTEGTFVKGVAHLTEYIQSWNIMTIRNINSHLVSMESTILMKLIDHKKVF